MRATTRALTVSGHLNSPEGQCHTVFGASMNVGEGGEQEVAQRESGKGMEEIFRRFPNRHSLLVLLFMVSVIGPILWLDSISAPLWVSAAVITACLVAIFLLASCALALTPAIESVASYSSTFWLMAIRYCLLSLAAACAALLIDLSSVPLRPWIFALIAAPAQWSLTYAAFAFANGIRRRF